MTDRTTAQPRHRAGATLTRREDCPIEDCEGGQVAHDEMHPTWTCDCGTCDGKSYVEVELDCFDCEQPATQTRDGEPVCDSCAKERDECSASRPYERVDMIALTRAVLGLL